MQSKHLCGPVAGAVPQVGTSLTCAFQALRGLLGLWEAGVEQGGVTDQAFLTAAGELFPGVCTAGSSLVLSGLSVLLITPCTPYHEEPHGHLGVLFLLPPAGGIAQTKGRGPLREAGPAVGPPGKGVGRSCWRLRGSRQGRC